jgi:hypothetical protein
LFCKHRIFAYQHLPRATRRVSQPSWLPTLGE